MQNKLLYTIKKLINDKRLIKKKIQYNLIGPYPPPLGGVSVYIYRYSSLLEDKGYAVKLICFNKLSYVNKMKELLLIVIDNRDKIYHLNELNFFTITALFIRPYKSIIVYTDHSGIATYKIKKIKKLLFSIFLLRLDIFCLVNEHLLDYYRENKINLPKTKILIQNAFIPPPIKDEKKILASYDNNTICFIKSRSPILIANAYRIRLYQNVDLYGLDMCIELIQKLQKEFKNIGLLFSLAAIGNQDYFNKIRTKIIKYGIEDNIHFLIGQRELWPLFKKSDLMVRPTYKDGYGISIAEALYFGCPAVASDVCKRPEGTVMFRNRDKDDFFNKCMWILKNEIEFINEIFN